MWSCIIAHSVITSDDLDRIKAKTSASESRLELLTIVQRRDRAWGHLLSSLTEGGQEYLGNNTSVAQQVSFMTLCFNEKTLSEIEAVAMLRSSFLNFRY